MASGGGGAEAMAALSPEERDSWGTPPEAYRYLDRRYRFVADMCASDTNHLHPTTWFTKERSCLNVSWAEHLERHCNVRAYPVDRESRSPILRLLLASKKRERAAAVSTDESATPPFVFLNVPYSDPEPFLEKCATECARGIGSVVLLKEQDGEAYWAAHVDRKAAEIVHITGRLAFLHPRTRKPQTGANFGSCLVVYDPRHDPNTPTIASWLSREALYAPI